MDENRETDHGRAVVVTEPDALFRRTRRYGTRFARLLRTVAASATEDELLEHSRADLPAELVLDADVVSLADVPAARGVSEDALDEVAFPEHERVGRTLVRPAVLEAVAETVEPGQSLADVESVLADHSLGEASAVLSRLGYRVEWAGLSGGPIRTREGAAR